MKPGQIFWGIAGLTVVAGLGSFFWDKVSTSLENSNISSLISEYKANGIATKSAEIFHPIANSENAWIEIAPIVLGSAPDNYKLRFQSKLALPFLTAGEKSDAWLIRKYLLVHQKERATVEKAFRSKSNFQVPKNYDEGSAVLYPEVAPLRELTQEFCLAAQLAAYEGDIKGIERNLSIALRLTKSIDKGMGQLNFLVSNSMQRIINQTALHLVEISPQSYPTVSRLMADDRANHTFDFNLFFQSTFLESIATARCFDMPEVEYCKENFLGFQTSGPSPDEVFRLVKFKDGDYVPKGKRMRKYFSDLLVSWKPVLERVKKKPTSLPGFSEIEAAQKPAQSVPANVRQIIATSTIQYENYIQIKSIVNNSRLYDLAWTLMHERSKTGKFPKTLSPKVLGNSFEYRSTGSGFILSSKPGSNEDPVLKISFPFRVAKSETNRASGREKIDAYRSGKSGEL